MRQHGISVLVRHQEGHPPHAAGPPDPEAILIMPIWSYGPDHVSCSPLAAVYHQPISSIIIHTIHDTSQVMQYYYYYSTNENTSDTLCRIRRFLIVSRQIKSPQPVLTTKWHDRPE
jgi:hypothetical protein